MKSVLNDVVYQMQLREYLHFPLIRFCVVTQTPPERQSLHHFDPDYNRKNK